MWILPSLIVYLLILLTLIRIGLVGHYRDCAATYVRKKHYEVAATESVPDSAISRRFKRYGSFSVMFFSLHKWDFTDFFPDLEYCNGYSNA